jgi:hypothetical protein
MPLYPTGLLNIRDDSSRKKHYEKLMKMPMNIKNYYFNHIWSPHS